MEEKEKDQEFKVEDRRHFDQEGNVRNSSGTETATEETKAGSSEEMIPPPGFRAKVDFISILLPYASAAMLYMGEMKDPEKEKVEEDLNAAHQMIDVLELLQEKTKGNLTSEEEKYLEGVLFDLRMRFMQKAKIIK